MDRPFTDEEVHRIHGLNLMASSIVLAVIGLTAAWLALELLHGWGWVKAASLLFAVLILPGVVRQFDRRLHRFRTSGHWVRNKQHAESN